MLFAGHVAVWRSVRTAAAQTDQLLPEIDAYYKITSPVRIWFQAKETNEAGDSGHGRDRSQPRFLRQVAAQICECHGLRFGRLEVSSVRNVRRIPLSAHTRQSPDQPHGTVVHVELSDPEDRVTCCRTVTARTWIGRAAASPGVIVIAIQLERTLKVRSYHPSPYASAEFYYESQYGKWSDTAIYAGCLFPIGKHFEFNPYYEHQNNTGKSPNQQ